jgi:hypothetical protein
MGPAPERNPLASAQNNIPAYQMAVYLETGRRRR